MKLTASFLACLGLLAPVLTATSITFVDIESGTTVKNWSNPDPVFDPENQTQDLNDKTLDLNGDNRFGGAGYYQITPVESIDTWGVNVDTNDLGITQPVPYRTRFVKPAFLSTNPVGEPGSFYNVDSFPKFKDPLGTNDLQQGILWLLDKTPGDVIDLNNNVIPGMRSKAFRFTMSEAANFRLGVTADVMNDGYYAPDYISVKQVIQDVITDENFSDPLERNGTPDMAFFDIVGEAGDVFEVALWQTDANLGTDGRVAFALVTFDQLPPTLTYELSGENILLSWEPEILGWILESSSDLGVSDSWEPVPSVVDNSVSVPMTGVPQNFFRLRKDP